MSIDEATRTRGPRDQLRLLSGESYWLSRGIPEAGVPAVRFADGPHGLRVPGPGSDHLGLGPSEPSTCFPPAATLASSWNPDLVREVGEAVAREARMLGVGVVLGPGLNIKRHPLCGRNFEYYSEDPLLSGQLAAASVEGIQGQGVGACLKHFAVNNQEHRRFVTDAVVDERTMREIYLRGFEHAVRRARPRAVMAAYNRVNGTHCTDSRMLLTGILREEWGFDGVVVSDWGAVFDRARAVDAGLDLEMPGGLDRVPELEAAISEGRLDRGAVARSADRVAALADLANAEAPGHVDVHTAARHDRLARRAAAESAVVLANDGVLPLAPGTRVALVGAFARHPRYQGGGSSLVAPTHVTTAFDALRDAGVDVVYAPGYDPRDSAPDRELIDEAVRVARGADVVVAMVGLPAVRESEGFDRDTLALPAQHDALVEALAAANPRTVVALSNGAPMLLPWRERVAAIVAFALGGQASGGAVADALLGLVEPAGRLAETYPLAREDVASDPWFPGGRAQVEYREGVFVGYRHTATAGVAVAYPFGHGLGYGRTRWTDAEVAGDEGDGMVASVTVTNEGDVATSDVVQVYLHDDTGVVLRPRRELAGFARVTLPPGESRRVRIPVPRERLAFWDVRVHDWRVPSGAFEVEIARSSAVVEASVRVDVAGDVRDSAEPPTAPAIAADDADFARRLGRPVPAETPMRPFTRDSTLGDLSTTFAGRSFRWIVQRSTRIDERTRADPVAMRMLERSTEELPIRALVQFSNGRMPWRVADAVVAFANGRGWAAIRRLLLG